MAATKLPADAIKFAKSMGISLEGLEAEAEDMWEMLNDLSEKNFDEYQSFIQQQFNDQEAASKGDGIKVRVAGDSSGKAVYINICVHEVVDAPRDGSGRVITNWSSSSTDLLIPFAVGQTRDLENNSSIAVDVVVHPSVLERCSTSDVFKRQVVDLVIDSVINDKAMQLKKVWSLHASSYVGGRGTDKKTPVLFPVQGPGQGDNARKKDPAKLMESPSMLLGAIKHDRESSLDGPPITQTAAATTTATTTKMSSTNSTSSVTQEKSSAPALKKGFLNSDARPSIYPEGGSDEGKGGATGGVYERFMSRCQVVDSKSVTQPPPAASKTSSSSGALPPTGLGPSKNEVQQMERLLSAVDDEWGRGSSGASSFQEAEEFSRALEQMSHLLTGEESKTKPHSAQSAQTSLATSSPILLPSRAPPTPPPPTPGAQDIVITGTLKVKAECVVQDGTHVLIIKAGGLESVDYSKHVTLDVCEAEVRLTVKSEHATISRHSYRFEAASATATFKKKRNELVMSVSCFQMN